MISLGPTPISRDAQGQGTHRVAPVRSLTESPPPLMSSEQGPAERLLERLTHGSGRYSVIAATVMIWSMDTLLSHRLVDSGAVNETTADVVRMAETISTALFVVTSLTIILALLRPYPRALFPAVATYLTFTVFQLIANVTSMLSTAQIKRGDALSSLWDVGAVYAMSVTVFMFVYLLMDLATPGGAFVWPAREGQAPPTPNLVDYLFISLNANSTYGPTSETVMSRATKLFMALQVLISVLMLTVLISRAVAATA